MSRSASTLSERWIMVGLAILQPIIVWGIHISGRNPLAESGIDLLMRLLLLGIAVWLRVWLFPGFRWAKLGGWLMLLGPVGVLSANGSFIRVGGLAAISTIVDSLSLGLMIGAILEVAVATYGWAAFIPPAVWPQCLAERFRRLRSVVTVQKHMALAMTVLLLLALYALARNYLFDWVLYSRLAALLISLGFLLPCINLRSRIQSMNEEELSRAERELETAIDRQLVLTVNGLEGSAREDVAFWLDYRRVLKASVRIPLSWEDWVYLLILIGVILAEPYLFGAWAL